MSKRVNHAPLQPAESKRPKTRRAKSPKASRARHDAFAWQTPFLTALRRDPNVSAAARKARVTRQSAYAARVTEGKDGDALTAAQQFAAAWDDAIQEALDSLEAEAWRRSRDGLVRKKFTRGGDAIIDPATGKQYVEREYSDPLMQFLLRVHRYGEKKQVEVTGKGGEPIQVEDIETVRARRWAQVLPGLAQVLAESVTESDAAVTET